MNRLIALFSVYKDSYSFRVKHFFEIKILNSLDWILPEMYLTVGIGHLSGCVNESAGIVEIAFQPLIALQRHVCCETNKYLVWSNY